MTPFGKSVATELRSALVPLETASIVDYRYVGSTSRALIRNALFYVVPTPAIERAREGAIDAADALATAIHATGVKPQGISLVVDQARANAVVAFEALIDIVADAEPTVVARCLGIG